MKWVFKLKLNPNGEIAKHKAILVVFRLKLNPNGKIAKHKARLVARGFMQKDDLIYLEIYAPMARYDTVRFLEAITCGRNWPLYH